MEHGIEEVARHPEVESGYEKEENTFENQPSGQLGLDEVSESLKTFMDRTSKIEKSLHLRIVSNTLRAGPFSDKGFLRQLMDFVTEGRHRLSVVVFDIPRAEDEINFFEIIQLFIRHPEYRRMVSLYEVKGNERASFTAAFRDRLFPYLQVYSSDQDTISLLMDEQKICFLTCAQDQWKLIPCFENGADRGEKIRQWFDAVVKEENQVIPFQLKEQQKEKAGPSVRSSPWNFFTNLLGLAK